MTAKARLAPNGAGPSLFGSRAPEVYIASNTTNGATMPDVSCTRCGQTRSGFERPPFPGALGARIVKEICQDCWGQWLRQQTMLINHYGLNVMDPQARSFLTKNLQAFLFKSGMEEDVDTSKKGTINW